MEDNPPSKMVRIPTPLVPVVQNLNKLYRQGYGLTLVHDLVDWISAIKKGGNVKQQVLTLDDNDLLSDVIARLERLESQQLPQGAMASKVGGNDANFNEALTQLTQRLDRIEKTIASVIEALERVPHVVDVCDVDVEEANDPASTPTLEYPLSQRQLSQRLNQPYPYYLKKHRQRGKEHFEAWSQSLDPDGVAWTFEEPTRRRGKVTSKALKFYPKR